MPTIRERLDDLTAKLWAAVDVARNSAAASGGPKRVRQADVDGDE